MLAAARCLDEADYSAAPVRHLKLRIFVKFWQFRAIWYDERDLRQIDQRLGLNGSFAGPQPSDNREQPTFKFTTEHRPCAKSAEQRFVHWGVKPVNAKMRLRFHRVDTRERFHGNPGCGVHRDVDANHISAT